jgi:hypothetical protein
MKFAGGERIVRKFVATPRQTCVDQLRWLLDGIDLAVINKHSRRFTSGETERVKR